MLEIVYSADVLFDLPPPTLFYRSDNEGFSLLHTVISSMLVEMKEVCLNDIEGVKITGTLSKIIYKPFGNNTLLNIHKEFIYTDISVDDWKSILEKLKLLSESDASLTYFIEFEGYKEDGNFILES